MLWLAKGLDGGRYGDGGWVGVEEGKEEVNCVAREATGLQMRTWGCVTTAGPKTTPRAAGIDTMLSHH
ncbi:hypothetical protein H2248_001941 [Termitomyces sp. 'cryptogamus']|nr:hypothetical protein H2248_001941 [Termitomyces sp. 'cryptogamus']